MVVVHTLAHLVVIAAKSALLLLLLFLILFHLPTPLNLLWTLLILTVQGLCGSAFGLLVACLCQRVLTGLLFLSFSLYVSLLFTGSMWTLLGLHTILQSVVWILPQTEAIKTLRNLLLVGKPVLPVTLALVIPSAWAAVFYCIVGCVLSIWG
uniref:(California timema) hypothetical protein n=1 Tax=Timema californicum TaxID=61474 RepID=A0A7R9JL12_TIMCA|nr:unnamed protein product [Timema californicum]